MRHFGIFFILALCAAALRSNSVASTLTLVVANHSIDVAAVPNHPRELLRVVWLDERLYADVSLDVYQIPSMRSTAEHYRELVQLARSNRWTDDLRWTLARRDTNAAVSLPMPRILRSTRRLRGREAQAPADRDTAVEMTSLFARLDFGSLPAGDYRISVNAAGLTSTYLFTVRTGTEPELRDSYLREKAAKIRDYVEFRRLELERFERDPSRLDAALELIDRSVVEGTPAEVTADFDRAIAGYESRRGSFAPAEGAKVDAYIADLRAARAALPEILQHRQDWLVARDPYTSIYSIRSRATNRVLRELKATTQ
jgi:hypothetical protein